MFYDVKLQKHFFKIIKKLTCTEKVTFSDRCTKITHTAVNMIFLEFYNVKLSKVNMYSKGKNTCH